MKMNPLSPTCFYYFPPLVSSRSGSKGQGIWRIPFSVQALWTPLVDFHYYHNVVFIKIVLLFKNSDKKVPTINQRVNEGQVGNIHSFNN